MLEIVKLLGVVGAEVSGALPPSIVWFPKSEKVSLDKIFHSEVVYGTLGELTVLFL